ncbi:MAG: ABC transporter ATP-binding protein/permease [Lachnospiraceae bacterium]|nr:ABC transporter ATP-binding protein/permease [Lachnospiraceae bacterium]
MRFEGTTDPNGIDKAIRNTKEELERIGVTEKSSKLFLLAFEEILLLYNSHLKENLSFTLAMKKRGDNIKVILTFKSEKFDPFATESKILENIIKRFEYKPEWDYKGENNLIVFKLPLFQTFSNTLAFSWKYAYGSRKIFAYAITSQIIAALLGIVAPAISARVVVAFTTNKLHQIMIIAVLLLIVQILRNAFMVFSNLGYNKAYTGTLSALERDLTENVLEIESQCIDEKGSGLFIQRTTSDTQRIANGFNSIADMIGTIFNYVGVLIAMFLVSPVIALFVLAIITVQCLMELARSKRLFSDDRIFRKHNEQVSGLVGEMIRGSKDVKLLNCEKLFTKKINETIEDANEKRWYMQKRSWTSKLFRWETGEFGSFILIVLLVYYMTNKNIPPTVAIVMFNYYTELGPNAVKVIGSFMDSIADFNISIERVYALIHSPDFPKEKFGDISLSSLNGDVTFDHVSFSYERKKGKKVLDDLCFRVKAGEMVGLVGKSGCGKSTAFNLIPKLYKADSGQVLIDGVSINKLTKETIRNNITIVSQNPYIFRMSVRDNLKIIKEDLTDEEMENVCRLACIDEDIKAMPDGYDTLIGEGGIKLSGGQRQRLAIARGMLKNSKIMLFDEATSALDNETQAKVQKAIDNMRADRTVIIIAHRLSTVYNADKIMFMQDGRIINEGTHEELIDSCEPYRQFAFMERRKTKEQFS